MHSLSRREFLKGSALLAATAATARFTATSVTEIQAQAPGGANERLNVAVIGVRGRGMSHVDGFADRNNCRVTHICDVDSAVVGRAVDRVRQRQGADPTVVTDMRRLFDNRDIHAVTVATPNHWHALAAIWAMQAGKDVYLEKPVSHNVSEGRRCVEFSRSTNKICQSGTQMRSSPAVRQAIEFLQAGQLGQVRVARGLCYKRRVSIGRHVGEVPIPATVDYNLWCGPAPQRPLNRRNLHYDWHWQWDYGCGDIGNQGPHQMDVARWGLGKTELPRAVQSVGGRFGYIDDGETANTQVAWYDYGEQQIIFEVRGLVTAKKLGADMGTIFHCANGYMVVLQFPTVAVAYDLDGNEIRRWTGGSEESHFANFVSAVRSRRREDLKADILEGHLSCALCHLGNVSYRLGQARPFEPRQNIFSDSANAQNTMIVMEEHLASNGIALNTTDLIVGPRLTVNTASENFSNNEPANRLLTRDYRPGFAVPARV
jgi:predicted dehydrogenase